MLQLSLATTIVIPARRFALVADSFALATTIVILARHFALVTDSFALN